MPPANRVLYLYSTPACHLCEQAHAVIAPYLEPLGIALEEVDISEDDDLVVRYGVRIPVLKFADGEEELGWPFGVESFLRFAGAGIA